MVGSYERNPGNRKYKNHSVKTSNQALEAIKNGTLQNQVAILFKSLAIFLLISLLRNITAHLVIPMISQMENSDWLRTHLAKLRHRGFHYQSVTFVQLLLFIFNKQWKTVLVFKANYSWWDFVDCFIKTINYLKYLNVFFRKPCASVSFELEFKLKNIIHADLRFQLHIVQGILCHPGDFCSCYNYIYYGGNAVPHYGVTLTPYVLMYF